MKKQYLTFCLLSLVSLVSFGQFEPRPVKLGTFSALNYPKVKPSTSIGYQKSILWTETFAGIGPGSGVTNGPTFTTANGTWTATGANGDVWKHTYYASSGEFSSGLPPLASTSAADGFMLFDSDSVNLPNSPNYVALMGELISPSIDLTSQAGIILSMQQDFRYCCSPDPHQLSVSVSSDNGVTWSAPYDLIQDLTQDGNGTHTVSANISADAAGNNVQLKFTWDGTQAGITHYFWAFDDICLSATPVNDIIASEPYFGTNGLSYYQIPISQIQPIDFSAKATNNGSSTQTNVSLDIDVDNGAFTASSSGIILDPWNDSLLQLTGQYTPPSILGTLTIDRSINQDEIDEEPINNQLPSLSIQINDNLQDAIYAREDGTTDGAVFNSGQGYEVGNIFEIFTSIDLSGISTLIDPQTVVDALIFARIYSIDPSGTFIQESQSDYHVVQASDLGTEIELLLIGGSLSLCQGQSYLITVGTDGDGGASNDLVIATSGISPEQTSFFFDWDNTQDWFYTTSTPIVRMIFNGANTPCPLDWGLDEMNSISNFELQPNPSSETTILNFELSSASTVSYELITINGSLLQQQSLGAKTEGNHNEQIDVSTLTNGMYYLRLISETGTVTKKFMKQ